MVLYKSMETTELKRHEAHISIAITVTAAIMAIAFHTLLFQFPYGIAFVIFMAILTASVHLLTILTGKRGNLWAYLFIIPLILSLVAEALYASDVVQAFGFMISVVSLTLFAFWFTVPPMRFWEIPSLWPQSLFVESFFPFRQFGAYARGLVKHRNNFSKVFMGIALAVPFLIIIGILFISADAFIQKTVSNFLNTNELQRTFIRVLWDAFAFIFFASAGSMLISRLSEGRRPEHHRVEHHVDHVIASTFLILLNILFAVFIGFQIVSFFGGAAVVLNQGITYAAYARAGFFQLLWVAIIVTGIVAAVYRLTGMRHWLIRSMSILLILQTGIVIASALRRMFLYIDAYGLSAQRFWATFIIYAIAAILLISIIAIIANIPYASLVKGVAVGVLMLASASLLMNADGIVANYNVNRYLSGASDQIDVYYLSSLSSGAIPALVRLAQERSELTIENTLSGNIELNEQKRTETLTVDHIKKILRSREQRLQDARASDWRELVFSDYQALAALGELR